MYTGKTVAGASSAVKDAIRRCTALNESLLQLAGTRLYPGLEATLSRLINSELNFLHRLSATSFSSTSPLSLNIGHVEAVVHVLQQPFVTGISRVCRPIRFSCSQSIYIDIVCSLNGDPVWFIVSDKNPRYIQWDGDSSGENKGLKQKMQELVDAVHQSPVMLRPFFIVLFFSHGTDLDVYQKLRSEFDAIDLGMEDKWTNLILGRSFTDARVVKIKAHQDSDGMKKNIAEPARIGHLIPCETHNEHLDLNLGKSFCSLLQSTLEQGAESLSLVNYDTTTLIAIVSGISNTQELLSMSEQKLRSRLKGIYEYVIDQIDSERENPIHNELVGLISGRRGIVCESVCSEFKDLISKCGGGNERLRAEYMLKFIKVVPDCPSTRVMSLPTTRRLSLKNKVTFGTGDYWHAPTVTANRAFVRAFMQPGVSLPVIEHRPRALIGAQYPHLFQLQLSNFNAYWYLYLKIEWNSTGLLLVLQRLQQRPPILILSG